MSPEAPKDESGAEDVAPVDELESHILSVHVGHASNCSSVGSVIDFLFLSATAGAALMAAVAAGLGAETTPASECREADARPPESAPPTSSD